MAVCTPGGVTLFLGQVLSDNWLIEAPGAFSLDVYTPRWCVYDGPPAASVYLCAFRTVACVFVSIIFVFGQPPVTLGTLTIRVSVVCCASYYLLCFPHVPGYVRCSEAQFQRCLFSIVLLCDDAILLAVEEAACRCRKFEENRSNLDENWPKCVAIADTKMATV